MTSVTSRRAIAVKLSQRQELIRSHLFARDHNRAEDGCRPSPVRALKSVRPTYGASSKDAMKTAFRGISAM